MYVFLIERPTPQRAPLLDRLHAALPEVVTFYLRDGETPQGWGEISRRHPARVLDSVPSRLALLHSLLSPRTRVVCVFGYRGWARVLAILVARARGVPLVTRSDSNAQDERERPAARRRLKRWYLRLLLGQPEVWTIGTRNEEYWADLGICRRVRIPYTTPVRPGGAEDDLPALRRDPRTFTFGFVGRLTEGKGVLDLLAAYDRVREHLGAQPTALVIAGTGPLEPQLRASAERRDDIHVLGPVPYGRLGAMYRRIDALVVPSRQEPWGLVVNEALSFGTPVVASDRVASADDLVRPTSGSRFPAGDVDALARAMIAQVEAGRRRVPPPPLPDVSRLMVARLRAAARR